MMTAINILRSFKSQPLKRISFFHDPHSTASQNLLGKLTRLSELPRNSAAPGQHLLAVPANRFVVDLQDSKIPTYHQYCLIHDSLAMHPENALAFEKVFPIIVDQKTHTLCKKTAMITKKQQKFVGDLELFSELEYKMIEDAFNKQGQRSLLEGVFNAPLIVDWENSLLATTDQGLHRIMTNYLSGNIQELQTLSSASPNPTPSHHHIHPHVAEFADLF